MDDWLRCKSHRKESIQTVSKTSVRYNSGTLDPSTWLFLPAYKTKINETRIKRSRLKVQENQFCLFYYNSKKETSLSRGGGGGVTRCHETHYTPADVQINLGVLDKFPFTIAHDLRLSFRYVRLFSRPSFSSNKEKGKQRKATRNGRTLVDFLVRRECFVESASLDVAGAFARTILCRVIIS